jgi:hypothetical protein
MGTDKATADIAAMLRIETPTIISILIFPSFFIFLSFTPCYLIVRLGRPQLARPSDQTPRSAEALQNDEPMAARNGCSERLFGNPSIYVDCRTDKGP